MAVNAIVQGRSEQKSRKSRIIGAIWLPQAEFENIGPCIVLVSLSGILLLLLPGDDKKRWNFIFENMLMTLSLVLD